MSDQFNLQDFDEGSEPNIKIKIKQQRDINVLFDQEKLNDLMARKYLRYWVSGVIGTFMLLQYTALYYFVYLGFEKNIISQLQWLYVTLFGGTLAETYFLARLIVKWLFAEIPYKSDSDKVAYF